MLRVLVAEDSPVTRDHLVAVLNDDPALHVVGAARNGRESVELAERLRPDVIVMDVHMPQLDGYEATRQIMARVPAPIVMVSSGFSVDVAPMTFRALEAGALTIVETPAGPDHPGHADMVRQFVTTVKLMAEVKVVRRWATRGGTVPPAAVPGTARLPARPAHRIRLVAIGASTGGPVALSEILAGLPRDLPVPVLVAQHIATGFIGGLAEWLGSRTPLAMKVASGGEQVMPATVYLAPDGTQMGLGADGRIRLTRAAADEFFCPSVSYLFRSVAETYGRSAVGILLTGMGRDGATGLRRLRETGAITIAQDEETSVIFGMPGEAVRLGAVEHLLSPPAIARAIRVLAAPDDGER